MAKKKQRQNRSETSRRYSLNRQSFPVQTDINSLRHLHEQQKRLTRDTSDIAKSSDLSLAEDLRRHRPIKNTYNNIDGSPAEVTYKPEIQKKSILRRLVLYGAMCLVSFVLGVLLSADVELYANKYYSLIKFF